MGILTLISSQRQPKMDSEGDSESSEFEEKAGRKILLAKKKVPPHSGRDTWQKLRLPTSQVYTLENANSNFLSNSYQNRPTLGTVPDVSLFVKNTVQPYRTVLSRLI